LREIELKFDLTNVPREKYKAVIKLLGFYGIIPPEQYVIYGNKRYYKVPVVV
jgi:hypothetical protein